MTQVKQSAVSKNLVAATKIANNTGASRQALLALDGASKLYEKNVRGDKPALERSKYTPNPPIRQSESEIKSLAVMRMTGMKPKNGNFPVDAKVADKALLNKVEQDEAFLKQKIGYNNNNKGTSESQIAERINANARLLPKAQQVDTAAQNNFGLSMPGVALAKGGNNAKGGKAAKASAKKA